LLTTIDNSGRILVPKRLREALEFSPGQQLELSVVDGVLEVKHPTTPMRLETYGGRLAAFADRPMPELASELVRRTLEQIRR
jgi:AbrB family looped-hinge helix DNA binding protein